MRSQVNGIDPVPPTISAAGASGYRPYLDGLRAVAVLSVVMFHAGVPAFSGGFIGVDVFFVISGYLIIGMLAREFELNGTLSLPGFYERRIRRLLPASLLVLCATLAMGAMWLMPVAGEQLDLAKSAVATLGLVSNLYFAKTSGGYFDQPANFQPLLHTWSLSVEEQFYLFWPLLLLLVGRLARRCGSPLASIVMPVLTGLALLSLGLSLWLTKSHPQWAFYLAPSRAWEFAAGGIAYFWLRAAPKGRPGSGALAASGLLAVVVVALTYSPSMAFPGWIALVPVAATVAIIAGCEQAPAVCAQGCCRRRHWCESGCCPIPGTCGIGRSCRLLASAAWKNPRPVRLQDSSRFRWCWPG